jgi:hypothetical protein
MSLASQLISLSRKPQWPVGTAGSSAGRLHAEACKNVTMTGTMMLFN